VTLLLLLGELLPVVLNLVSFGFPFLSYNLGDLWIGELWVFRDDLRLMVLAVEDESCITHISKARHNGCRTVGDGMEDMREHKSGSECLLLSAEGSKHIPNWEDRKRCYVPFRGLGILGAGVQRHMESRDGSVGTLPSVLTLNLSEESRSISSLKLSGADRFSELGVLVSDGGDSCILLTSRTAAALPETSLIFIITQSS
jgi:hypothetical protein